MAFQANARNIAGVTVVDASGSLTLASGGTAIRDVVQVLLNKGQRKFLLNLAGVDFIDSYGIGELVRCNVTIRRQGGEVRLAQLQKKVSDLLQICKVNALFEIFPNEATALASFR